MEDHVTARAEPVKKRQGLLARFARDRRGIAALEFGMVSIPFLGLLCAIFETAFVYYNHQVFDNAVANVARQILVNQYSSNTTPTAAAWVTTPGANGYSLCGSLPSYFICSNVRVNVTALNPGQSFGNVAALTNNFMSSNPNSTNINLGQPGAIVVFQAFYPMPIYLSVLLSAGAQGNQATNLYSQTSNSVITNPVTGSGLVHKIYSVAVFRNEPS